MIDFAEYMDQERARIHGERATLVHDREAIEVAIRALDHELVAIDAYAQAKAGKVPAAKRVRSAAANGARPGSRRGVIIATLSANPQGLGRGDLLQALGVKGDKSGEMAVSNALTALIKSNALARHEGKYVLAA